MESKTLAHNKILAIFVMGALLTGVWVASIPAIQNAHADNPPKYSGPGHSDKVSSNSFKQCEKRSPGNSPCN